MIVSRMFPSSGVCTLLLLLLHCGDVNQGKTHQTEGLDTEAVHGVPIEIENLGNLDRICIYLDKSW